MLELVYCTVQNTLFTERSEQANSLHMAFIIANDHRPRHSVFRRTRRGHVDYVVLEIVNLRNTVNMQVRVRMCVCVCVSSQDGSLNRLDSIRLSVSATERVSRSSSAAR